MTKIHSVKELRTRLGMNSAAFARLIGVEPRTVYRWEEDEEDQPAGAARAVLKALKTVLAQDGERTEALIKFVTETSEVGGLAYLLMRLLETTTLGSEAPVVAPQQPEKESP